MVLDNFLVLRGRKSADDPVIICYLMDGFEAKDRVEVTIPTAAWASVFKWPDEIEPGIADLNAMAEGNMEALVALVKARYAKKAATSIAITAREIAALDPPASSKKVLEAGSEPFRKWLSADIEKPVPDSEHGE